MNLKPALIPLAHAKPPPWDRRPWVRRIERVIWIVLLLLVPVAYQCNRAYEELSIAAEMRYRAPPGTVVYDDDRQNAPLLVGTQKYQYLTGRFINTGPRPSPAVWVARPMGTLGNDFYGWCFLHRRRTPAGARRLVSVFFQMFLEQDAGYRLIIDYGSSSPAAGPQDSGRFASGEMSIDVPAGVRLRIFAGVPDDADESHLTVRYELGGQSGTIDGWLRSDEPDGMVLKVQDGPLKLEKWTPPPEWYDPRRRATMTSPTTPATSASPTGSQWDAEEATSASSMARQPRWPQSHVRSFRE